MEIQNGQHLVQPGWKQDFSHEFIPNEKADWWPEFGIPGGRLPISARKSPDLR